MLNNLSGELSRMRMEDLMREAEGDRLAKRARRSRMADERSTVRRFTRTALAAVVWPIKH